MIGFVQLAIDLINRYTLWIYAVGVVVILFYLRMYLLASRGKRETIFSLERETATQRQSRALSSMGGVLAVMVVITVLKYYVMPSIDLSEVISEATATPFAFVPTKPVPTPTPTTPPSEPTPTQRPRPTLRPRSPTPTTIATSPTLRPAPCPDPNVRITFPRPGMVVTGMVQIRGTAAIERFQFYKLEYGIGTDPEQWSSLGDIRKEPVRDGLLETWNTEPFPAGTYHLRLTVVDASGNFPPPCEIAIVIQR